MMYTDISRGRPFAKDPAVVFFRDGYLLYYSLPPYENGRRPDGYAIGVAKSADLDSWHKVGEIQLEHPYEKNGICAPGAIVLEGKVHLFYQTYGNGPEDAICHATSRDGIHFVRNPSNPIFSPSGNWNNGRAIDADVVMQGERLLLYFATRDPSGSVQKLGVASAKLASGFGREAWHQETDAPILEPELPWEKTCIEAPAVCCIGELFYMFYAGAYNNAPQQIGCAVSEDGFRWQRLGDKPFLPNGQPDKWNTSESGHPYVFLTPDGEYVLFFQGNNDNGRTWHLSSVRLGWESGRPYVSPGDREE